MKRECFLVFFCAGSFAQVFFAQVLMQRHFCAGSFAQVLMRRYFCAGSFCASVEIKACVFEITKSID